jgi:hypothetical protein
MTLWGAHASSRVPLGVSPSGKRPSNEVFCNGNHEEAHQSLQQGCSAGFADASVKPDMVSRDVHDGLGSRSKIGNRPVIPLASSGVLEFRMQLLSQRRSSRRDAPAAAGRDARAPPNRDITRRREYHRIALFFAWSGMEAVKAALPLAIATLIMSASALGIGGYIGYAGGHIRHEEFRFKPPPTELSQSSKPLAVS